MSEIIGEFLVESHENLDRLDRELVELERDPGSREVLASIFRTIHTIKGTAGLLGFEHLESISHVGENLLSRLRDGELPVTVETVDALLAMVDAIRLMLAHVDAAGTDGDDAHAELIETLAGLAGGGAASGEAPSTGDGGPPLPDAHRSRAEAGAGGEAARDPAEPADGGEPPRQQEEPTSDAARVTGADSSIRVDVRLLDQLMNLVGELVLARNQILQFTTGQVDQAFLSTSQQLNLITTELQEGVMKTRMQPIGNIWSKFPRVVRDLATSCGKRARLEMEGAETELDKTIIEAIKDPLTHLVRNSVDHGIEHPEVRRAAGKSDEGVLRLRAYHEGGQVIIEVSDDGAGLDHAQIRNRAMERGLVAPEAALQLSDRETAELIFTPGFSTADAVTNVSGRGVGMDVVKTNIEKIGGNLDVYSEPGRGTTLVIKIPLTLAIIPALIVSSGGCRYAIPQVSLVQLLRLDGEKGSEVEMVGSSPVHRLRGRLLPILDLRDVLGLDHGASTEGDDGVRNIVVLQADGQQFGLAVDQINDTEEIVVKPLGPHLKSIAAFAGTTIMGDGTVALILDALGIAYSGGVINERTQVRTQEPGHDAERPEQVQSVLVCSLRARRVGIPLEKVSRLEEFDAADVELAAGRPVVQYRDRLLPLVRLDGHLGEGPHANAGDAGTIQVLVCTVGERFVGLVVDEILDVLDADLSNLTPGPEALVVGSCPMGGRVTDLVDVDEVVERAEGPQPIAVGG